ncbi:MULTISPECIES: hypothetical protein [unclassified Gilliamella]|uniref:hypothetical protein n=1 Tax=unclassified Gilliamella TaxID=2685620 RepID=UPI00130578C8|nr:MULTISPECIES: hypothetical protein [unclassified Gilliamella]MWP48574.1 hypothetical protein [Gilliamella sp. Lep-s35]MWP68636.1 hypothetical protein [Gilliamella sp. Lep-s5]MWP76696.1 hypothetical protein [Gilliamella sp. Lep-s21]
MNKYYVILKVVTESYKRVEVEANFEEEAEVKAKELLNSTFYTYTDMGEDTTVELEQVIKYKNR